LRIKKLNSSLILQRLECTFPWICIIHHDNIYYISVILSNSEIKIITVVFWKIKSRLNCFQHKFLCIFFYHVQLQFIRFNNEFVIIYIYNFNLRMQINNVDFIVKNKCKSTEIKQSRYTLYNVYYAAHTRIGVSNQKEPSSFFLLGRIEILHYINRIIFSNFYNICPLIK